jgi:hypothetical protein
MGRTAKLLLCAAIMLGLATFGSVDSLGQQAKGDAPKAVEKAVEKAAVKAAPAMAVRAVANDAVIKQWEQQFGPQIRQLHRMELHFMRLVTEPTRQQYEKIAADSEPAVKDALKALVEGLQSGQGVQSDPRVPIAEAIAKAAQSTLSPEQATRYQKEIDLRIAARKRLVVLNLVSMIDRVLVLRPDQREKIGEILTGNWNEAWNQTQMLMYGGQYFPPMPDAKIDPILSDAQRTVWRGISKGNIRFGVNFGFMQGMAIEDEEWADNPPKKKVEPAAAKPAAGKPGPPKADEKP